jgi:uncharacterized protein (TIGR00255 family)
MTGFGKAICELPAKRVIIEIKSLNSKQLDINTRIPNIYREKELQIRNEISRQLQRGKVDISFYVESLMPDKITQVNEQVISDYHAQLKGLSQKLGITGQTDLLRIIMSLPDTLKTEQAQLEEAEWQSVFVTLGEALSQLEAFRIQEGRSLEADMIQRSRSIGELLLEVEPYEAERIEKIKTRIRENLEEFNAKQMVDENRFEQELIYYIEKLDVSEEKVRLGNHLKYFAQTLKEEEPVGKKLGFITQEMGREINTLGSKANDADLQRLVIRMKDDLEKIKEQVLNIL